MTKYSLAEYEVIGLCIALEALDEIANHMIFDVRDHPPGETEVYFHTEVHQQLFSIRFLDFSKEGGDSSLTGVPGSCLEIIESACRRPCFDRDDSVIHLKSSTAALREWLDAKTPFKLWLPTLDIEPRLEIPRSDFLYISGNQLKHNLSRTTALSKRLVTILKEHGYDVPVERIPLALDDFRIHLEEDFFIYYCTQLVELLNNLRWGIQDYLLPTFTLSYKKDPNSIHYFFEYPDSIQAEIPREWYWRLMNHIRSGPNIKRFVAAQTFKRDLNRS